jgi:hypothetical protein
MSQTEPIVEDAAFKWLNPGAGLSLADLFHALSSCNLKEQIVVVQSLVMLPDRLPETLRSQYLSPMCRTRELEMAFPDAPNDSLQTYTTRKP